MSEEADGIEKEPGPRHERRSSTPRILLPLVGLFLLVFCYVAIAVIRGGAPANRQQVNATATAQAGREVDAGATVAAELEAEATQTALALPGESTPGPQVSLTPPTTAPGRTEFGSTTPVRPSEPTTTPSPR